jgi:diguanylate cyclase (GGDEF)-like protein
MDDDVSPRNNGASGVRILVLSAGETEADVLSRMLREQLGNELDVVVARSVDDARARLEADAWACAVLVTSDELSHDTIRALLHHDGVARRLPVVMIGDGPAGEAGKNAVLLGADDYVTRAELDGGRLASSVLLAIERGRRSALEPPMRDPVTGLANRLLFIDRLRLALARRRREGQDVMVTYIDLDSFKDINDLLGHFAGDTVLVTVAARLRGGFRATDTVARLGGDEFGVLCEGPELRQLEPQLMGKIDAVFRRPVAIDGEDLVVAASVGTVFAENDERDPEALLARADAEMYQRKRASTGARPRDGGHQSIDDLRV